MKRLARRWAWLGLFWALIVGLLTPAAGSAATAVVVTDQVRAELVIHAPGGLQPGQQAWLGLKIEHRPQWHTYWLNPGDSGLPTMLQWTLPAGMEAGDIQWPVPHRLPIGPLMNHGYEDTVLLAVPLKVTQAPSGQPLTIKLRADWLVCKDVCIPEGGDFALTLPAGAAQSALARHRGLFEQTWAQLPVKLEAASARAQVGPDGLDLELKGLPAAWHGRTLAIFPEAPHLLAPAVEPQARWEGSASSSSAGTWFGRLAPSAQRLESPTEMTFVVAPAQSVAGDSAPAGVRVTAAVSGTWPDPASAPIAAAVGGEAPSASPGNATPSGSQTTVWVSILLALIGGAILNLMPCVFPVLSLKVFGFAQHAQDRRALAVGGLAYTVGVVVSFCVLAALLLALRGAGEQIGWGFQLQSPVFVAGLALLFTLIGLNLLGLFELTVLVPQSAAGLQARHPVVDQFLTGVLAVVVASPCTAPFMGASLGAAVTMPPLQAMLVFAALGVGMALPYLALTLMPQLARRLPRPGVWMLHFKHAMALPMLATVVWLLWVLGHQVGVDAVVGMLGLLLVLCFAIGAWKLETARSGLRLAVRAAAAAAVVASGLWAWPSLNQTADAPMAETGAFGPAAGAAGSGGASGASGAAGTTGRAGSGEDALWQPWSAAALADAQARGQVVFVDFTAAWCVTCQVNKRTTLRDPKVLQAFADRGVLLMRADWTRRDEAITRELTRLQRTGVPVYALYSGQPLPQLLPEVLTPALVIQAVSALPAVR